MNAKPLLVSIMAVVWFSSRAGAAQTNFFDGTFNQTNWTVIQADGFDGTITAYQMTNGGNPGYYMLVNELNFSNWISGFYYQQFGVYQPLNIPGALINYSIDEYADVDDYGVGVGVQPALRQNGTNYFCNLGWGNSALSNWVTYSTTNLAASNFDNFIPGNNDVGGPGHPDFSAAGSAIQFGYATWNNNNGLKASRAAGFDNWTVVVYQPGLQQGPLLTNAAIVGGTQFRVQLLATVGHDYNLQSSTNFSVWQTIFVTNNVNTNLVTLVDTNPISNSIRNFYRVVDDTP
jgi:hypothetical protein